MKPYVIGALLWLQIGAMIASDFDIHRHAQCPDEPRLTIEGATCIMLVWPFTLLPALVFPGDKPDSCGGKS